MTIRADGRKKSEFIAKDTVQAGGYLDYVVSGTNYKISYDNFVANLGVTGSIVQEGAVTGTAILDVDGTINQIRNLESGSGIVTSVSAENGAKISHNFTANADGLPILLNTTAASPTIASIVAGSGISVTAVNAGGIQITSIANDIYAQVSMHDNTTLTTINTINVPVKAAGTFATNGTSNFTSDTTGRLTYTGATTETVTVMASVSIDVVGVNQKITIYIAKNGIALSAAKINRVFDSGDIGNVGIFYNISMTASDYLEVFVANATGTNNLTVTDVLFGVS